MAINRNRLTRRGVLKGVGASVGAAALAGCTGGGGGGGGGNGSVTLQAAGGGGSWGKARQNEFFEPYANGKNPWQGQHKYQYTEQSSNQYMAELQRNPENPAFDIVELDNLRAPILGELGALVNQADTIDTMSDVPDVYKSEWMGGSTVFPRGIGYRNDKLDKEFKTWDDLIDPDLKGKVAFEPWANAGSKFFYVINAAKGGDLNNLEPGFTWLKKFVETTDPVFFDQVDQAMQLFRNDEIYAASFLSARTSTLRIEDGLDMAFSIPETGSFADYWGWPILKNRPEANVEASKQFLEGVYNPKIQAAFSENYGYPPAVTKAQDLISEETKKKRPYITLSSDQRDRFDNDIDWVQVAKQQSEDGQRWSRIVGS